MPMYEGNTAVYWTGLGLYIQAGVLKCVWWVRLHWQMGRLYNLKKLRQHLCPFWLAQTRLSQSK